MNVINTLKAMLLILAVSALLLSLNSCSSGGANDEWRMQFYPAVGSSYATLSVYSTKTGAYENFYIEDGNWVKNESIPSPNITIKKGDLRIEYLPATPATLPGLSVYDAQSGQYEQLYLEEGEWKKNPHIPQPNITLSKGDLRMEYIPGNTSTLATLNVYSTTTKEYEQLYLDGNEWKRNPNFPAANKM